MSLEKIKNDRLKKLTDIRAAKINPYPAEMSRLRQDLNFALENFDDLTKARKEVVLAGRLRLIREHGGSTFADLEDASGQIQIYFKILI